MQAFVTRRNIERFKTLIARERDPRRREDLERMLGDEQAKLVELLRQGAGRRTSPLA